MSVNSFEDYPMSWKPVLGNEDMPIYRMLAQILKKDILEGKLTPGTKLRRSGNLQIISISI